MGLEYYAFDKVLGELGMDEDELKRLVSEGQIRAFRDENRMKFRKDDIDSLKKGKQTEPTIILPEGALDDGGNDELFVVEQDTEETILDLEGIGDSDFATDESSVPSLDFDEAGAGAETLTEELVFDEEDDLGDADGTEEMSMDDDYDDMGMEATQKIDSDAAFLDDDEFGMQTEPLQTFEDDDADATMVDNDFTEAGGGYEDEEEDEAEETLVSRPKPARGGRRAAPAPRAAAPAPAAAAVASRPVGIIWVVLLGFIFTFYALAALCLYDYSTNSFTGVSKMIAEPVSENMMEAKFQDPTYTPTKGVGKPDWLDKAGTTGEGVDQPTDPGIDLTGGGN
ncbi:MAG: hypothetical protein AB7K09_06930 [Planctomycetota bacterium]